MAGDIGEHLSQFFGDLADSRRDHTRRHLLIDIIVITICAVLGGADDFEAVAEFGVAKASWLRTFLTLPNGIPAHDTLWRVFRALDPVAFERCFRAWVAAVIELHPGQVIAGDGKTLRRAHKCAASSRSRVNGASPRVTNRPHQLASRPVITSPAQRAQRLSSIGPCARTGASKTLPTGSAIGLSVRMNPASAQTMALKTWPCCGGWRSACSNKTKPSNSASRTSASRPPGIMTISFTYSRS